MMSEGIVESKSKIVSPNSKLEDFQQIFDKRLYKELNELFIEKLTIEGEKENKWAAGKEMEKLKTRVMLAIQKGGELEGVRKLANDAKSQAISECENEGDKEEAEQIKKDFENFIKFVEEGFSSVSKKREVIKPLQPAVDSPSRSQAIRQRALEMPKYSPRLKLSEKKKKKKIKPSASHHHVVTKASWLP